MPAHKSAIATNARKGVSVNEGAIEPDFSEDPTLNLTSEF